MYAAFRLKVEHDSVESGLDFIGSEIAFPPDYEEYYAEKSLMFSRQGMAAIELIRSLKDHYGVPTKERREYNPRDKFDRKLEERRKLDEKHSAHLRRTAEASADPTKPPGLFPLG